MAEITAEQLAQRAYDCRLLESREVDRAFAEAGGRGAATFDDLQRVFLQRGLLTNWQIQRLVEGHRRGYFYGDWKVLYLVGAGTFARVYRAVNRKSGEMRAVKVLRNRYSSDADTRQRFLREGRMVMKLRHPNIVPIYEVAEDRGRTYMVMEFVEGQNLRDFVRAQGKVPMMVALRITRDVCAGLDYAFNLGICHRDIKLSNVLLSTDGVAKLVDFGLAAVNQDVDEDGLSQPMFNPRSIDYAGLEKATNVRRDDKRSDIFFLGCLLYHMLSGQSPLEETRERIKRLSPKRYREIPPLTNYEPDLPHRVVILTNRLMDLDPERRPQTPGLALREIESCIEAVEAGQLEKYDDEQARRDAEAYARLTHRENEGTGKTILVLESNQKVQDALREKLKELGYRVLIISDANRGIGRFLDLDPAEDAPADCVIFSCAGLGLEGLDAFNTFAETDETKNVPAILLLPEALNKYAGDAKVAAHRKVLSLPLRFNRVRKTLKELLQTRDAVQG